MEPKIINMLILGYILAIGMGFTLGALGAGGSMLTVPILVYLLDVQPLIAISYSFLIVGTSALLGAIQHWQKKKIDLYTAAIFVVPSTITVLITRHFIVTAMPDSILGLHKNICIMLLFATLMIITSVLMLSPIKTYRYEKDRANKRFLPLIAGSMCVGFLTGIIGVGGGFLIIPALIILFKLDIHKAIGTSLSIIAINSLIGFGGDLSTSLKLNWLLLGAFLSLTLFGVYLGIHFSNKLDNTKLKKILGMLSLIVGITTFITELHAI